MSKAKSKAIRSHNPKVKLWPEFEEALVGISFNDEEDNVAIYDYDRVIAILRRDCQCEWEDAADYFTYNYTNVIPDNGGKSAKPPIFVQRLPGVYLYDADSDEPISPGDDDGLDGRAY